MDRAVSSEAKTRWPLMREGELPAIAAVAIQNVPLTPTWKVTPYSPSAANLT